jgi:predicted ATPase
MSSSRKTTSKGSERFNLRLEAPLKARLTEAATKAGFATVSAYVRHILMREADGQSTGRQLDDMEHKTIATIDRLSREVHQLRIQHMATWSLVDALTKAFFTCVPEPAPQMTEQATANAKRRYDRLLLVVAQTMRTQGPATLRELERNVGS